MNITFTRQLASATLAVACIVCARVAPAAVNWRPSLDAAKIEAAQSQRFILIHFWAPNCEPCQKLDQVVFSDPTVGPALEKDFVPVKIDTSTWPAIRQAFGVEEVPTEVILSPQGDVLLKPEIPRNAGDYVRQLGHFAAHYRQAPVSSTRGVATSHVNPAYASLPISSIGSTNAGAANSNQRGVVLAQATAPGAAGNASVNPYVTTQPVASAAASNAQAGPAATGGADRYGAASTAVPQNASPYQATPSPAAGTIVPGAAAQVAAQSTTQTNVHVAQQTAQASVGATPSPSATAAANAGRTPTVVAATPGATAAGSPTTPTPPAAAPLGLEGYCPVSLSRDRKWIKGSPDIGIIHRGRTYLFAKESDRQQFRANPDMYSPAFNGLDPVLLIDEKRAVEGTRRFGYKHQGTVFLFSSKETMAKFGATTETADAYAVKVLEAMRRLDASTDTVRR